MTKKNVLCPACSHKLIGFNGEGHCAGTVIVCPKCGASILVDADSTGRMKLSVEPSSSSAN